MANIEINNLNPAGSELFHDSESFLNELNDREIWGGIQPGAQSLGALLSGETLSQTLSQTLSISAGNSGFNITGADSIGSVEGTLGNTLGLLPAPPAV